MILVTGGVGFIGSNFILDWLAQSDEAIINYDSLTYAANVDNLRTVWNDPRHIFLKGDICASEQIVRILSEYRPRAIIHFAAQTHVDRSIAAPAEFVTTNVNGTFNLLEATRGYWTGLNGADCDRFRFVHISTDEVYGTLAPGDLPFDESAQYAPNSPYAASKAAADHLVRAYYKTYGLPTLITHCSNNYGPYQFPEKLISRTITNALDGAPVQLYGDGLQIRDWLYVSDHCNALRRILASGIPGTKYNIGGSSEKTNIEVVEAVCRLLDNLAPKQDGTTYRTQITYVADRLGHDRRYAINAQKIQQELAWAPEESFLTGMRKTVEWYLQNYSAKYHSQAGCAVNRFDQDGDSESVVPGATWRVQ
jgi:dTDP-glucose 4,6-dehydratase